MCNFVFITRHLKRGICRRDILSVVTIFTRVKTAKGVIKLFQSPPGRPKILVFCYQIQRRNSDDKPKLLNRVSCTPIGLVWKSRDFSITVRYLKREAQLLLGQPTVRCYF